MGKIQALWSRTLPSPSSVSKARNRSPDHWVFWDSRIDAGASVPRCDGIASAERLSNVPRRCRRPLGRAMITRFAQQKERLVASISWPMALTSQYSHVESRELMAHSTLAKACVRHRPWLPGKLGRSAMPGTNALTLTVLSP